MAEQPTPRSFQRILGEMVGSLTSRTGIQGLRVGNPLLTVLEAAAQSDARTAQDVWNLLDSLDLDRATGSALRRIGEQEGVSPIGARPAVGSVDIEDSRFQKVASSIYAGISALSIGATSIPINDAAGFPERGTVYIGRGTGNTEGPLEFTSIVRTGGAWNLILREGVATTRYHGPLEEVVLGQGGDRLVPANTVVQTADLDPVVFRTRQDALLLDGEVAIKGIPIVADRPGVSGNLPARSIRVFASEPFPGASVSNPLPTVKGEEEESQESYKDRIRKIRRVRRSQNSGTATAIQQAVLGVSDDDSKVTSASVVYRPGEGTVIYIDDGTGYEPDHAGVAFEVLCSSAIGGERYFQLNSPRPVARAFLVSTTTAPFAMRGGMTLAVRIGDTTYTHTFSTMDFKIEGAATAREIAASINSGTGLGFVARTADSGSRVILTGIAETPDEIEVVRPDSGVDANTVLGFPAGEHVSLRLYKNSRLLYRNGHPARIHTAQQADWDRSISNGDTLILDVDGTGARTYTFFDLDFTGYRVSANTPLATWAKVLESKIPGLSVRAAGTRLVLESNRGASDTASLEVVGGTLFDKGVFSSTTKARGRKPDYEFNRQLGQVALAEPLAPGDHLAAGTLDPGPYLESPSAKEVVTFSTPAHFVFVVDADAQVVHTQIGSDTNITVSRQGASGVRYFGGTDVFAGAKPGDWLVNIDPSLVTIGAWPIGSMAEDASWVQIERQGGFEGQGRPTSNGLLVIRTNGIPQILTIAPGTYPVSDLAARFGELSGVGGRIHNGYLQVYSVRLDGSIACLAASTSASVLGLQDRSASGVSDNAALAGGASWVTSMRGGAVAEADGHTLTLDGDQPAPGDRLRWHHPDLDNLSANAGLSSALVQADSTVIVRDRKLAAPCIGNRYTIEPPLAIGAEEKLELTVDGDEGLTVPLGYRILPAGPHAVSGREITVTTDSGISLAEALGEIDLADCALHARPRAVTHSGGRAILWRYGRTGPDGDGLPVSYEYSDTPNTPPTIHARTESNPGLEIRLGAGQARTDIGWQPRTCLDISSVPTSRGYRHTLALYEAAIPPGSATRIIQGFGRVKLRFDHPHPFQVDDIIYIKSNDARFPPGSKRVLDADPDGDGKALLYFEVGALADNTSTLTVSAVAKQPDLLAIKVGDVINLAGTELEKIFPRPIRVVERTANALKVETKEPLVSTGRFFLGNTSRLACYPVLSISASELCQALPADAVLAGTPLDPSSEEEIELSTDDEFLAGDDTSVPVVLEGGINWIAEADLTTTPNRLVLKKEWTGSTVDLENEYLWLVPEHPEVLARWLQNPFISALPTRATVSLSADDKIIVKSRLAGAAGTLAVRGTPLGISIPIVGEVTTIKPGSRLRLRVKRDSAAGLTCGPARIMARTTVTRSWVLPPNVRTSITKDAQGRWIFAVEGGEFYAPIWSTNTNLAPVWRFERHGKLASIRNIDGKEFPKQIPQSLAVVRFANEKANMGIFLVHNILPTSQPVLWIDNPNAQPETIEHTMMGQLELMAPGAVVPGDFVDVASDVFGAANRGRWRVVAWKAPDQLVVDGPKEEIVLPSGAGVFAPSVRILEGKPAVAWIWIRNIIPNGEYLDLICDAPNSKTTDYPIGETRQSVLELPNKLAMDATSAHGRDAYHRVTGLIEECARIVYGDERNTTIYPGLQAAGATVDIQAPVIRRIRVSLALRCKGDHLRAVDLVRSAVASEINSLGVGEPVSIGRLVATASEQPGIVGVSVLSPAYGAGRELIPVQPHEKPQVLDLDSDISIKVLGA